MEHRSFALPHATGLTLVAARAGTASATGVARSHRHAMTLAAAELQERLAEQAAPACPGICGLGTARSRATADRRAQTEAYERLATHLWWFHGHAPQRGTAPGLPRILRDIGRNSLRILQTGTLAPINDVTTHFAITYQADGRHLCFGFGTHLRRAVTEAMQMEFAADLLAAKQAAHLPLAPAEEQQWQRLQTLQLHQIAPLLSPRNASPMQMTVKVRPLHNPSGPLKVSRAQIIDAPCHATPSPDHAAAPWRQWSPT